MTVTVNGSLKKDRKFWQDIALVSVLGGLLLIGLELFQPFYFTHDDNATQQLPWHVYNYRCLTKYGQLAFVNLHQYLGHEHYASGQTGVLYLPAYLASWLAATFGGSVYASIEVDAALHLLAGMVAMYVFCQSIQVSRRFCIYAAILYGTAPFILIASKSWLAVVYSAFYIPAILACLEVWLRENRIRWLVLSISLKLLFFYQGNIQFLCFYLFAEALYLVSRIQVWRIKKVYNEAINYVFSNLVFVAGTLPLSVLMKIYTAKSAFRSGPLSKEASLSLAIDPLTWIKAQFLVFMDHSVILSSSAAYYLGGFILALFLLFSVFQKASLLARSAHLWALCVMFTVCFVLGTRGNILIRWLPPFDSFRWPFKWYGLCVFAYVALFAITVNHFYLTRKLSASWLHVMFVLAIGSQLFVVFSPKSQIAFGPHHVLPGEVETVLGSVTFAQGRSVPFGIKSVSNAQEVLDTRTFNFPTLLDEYAFGGYDALFSKGVNEKVYDMNYSSVLFELLSEKMLKNLSQWSVRYLIIDERKGIPLNIETFPSLKRIGKTAAGFSILENTKAKPFAWMENEPDRKIDFRLQANQISINAHGNQGRLILSFLNLPGWEFSVDGGKREVPLSNEKGQMAVDVSPGSEQIFFHFIPPLFLPMIGLALILSTTFSLIWFWWFRSKRFLSKEFYQDRHFNRSIR